MRTNAELNKLALAATQATAKLYLGNEALTAVNRAAFKKMAASKAGTLRGADCYDMSDPDLAGLFDSIKKVVKKVIKPIKKVVNKAAKVAREVAPVALNFVPGAGPMLAQAAANYQANKALEEEIAAGNIPAPPTDINSPAFLQYAAAMGAQNAAGIGGAGALTEAEKLALLQKIQALQGQSVQQLPSAPQFIPMPQVPVPVQQQMAQASNTSLDLQTALLIGVPVLLVAMMAGKK